MTAFPIGRPGLTPDGPGRPFVFAPPLVDPPSSAIADRSDVWTLRRHGPLTRQFEVVDRRSELVGDVVVRLRTAVATDATGSRFHVHFDRFGAELTATQHGQRIASVFDSRLALGDASYVWDQPADGGPLTVCDGLRTLLQLERPKLCREVHLDQPDAFVRPFVIVALAAIAVTRHRAVDRRTFGLGER